MKEQYDLLDKIPLFAGLGEKALKAVAEAFHETSFSPGETIIKDSDRSPSFYVLVKGVAEVRREGGAIAVIRPYEFFGELVALGFQRQRTADVVAVEDCTCLVAEHAELQQLISSNRYVGQRILGEVSARYSADRQPR